MGMVHRSLIRAREHLEHTLDRTHQPMATEQLTEPATGNLDNRPEAATIEEYLVPGRLYRYIPSGPMNNTIHMVVVVERFLDRYPSASLVTGLNSTVDFTVSRCVTVIDSDSEVETFIMHHYEAATASYEPVE